MSKDLAQLWEKVDRNRLPRHIAIIMDGNGRWAKERGWPRMRGHQKGVEVVRQITRFVGRQLKIDALTIYVFSTENWNRPRQEIDGLMRRLKIFLRTEIKELNKNEVRLHHMGERQRLPQDVRNALDDAIKATASNKGLILNLAINYGARPEIISAIKKIVVKIKENKLSVNDINEKNLESFLYSANLPPVDLLIRTGGEKRVSNFLLWQIAYAEIYFTPVCWPDFSPGHLLEAIIDYQKRERRYGAIKIR